MAFDDGSPKPEATLVCKLEAAVLLMLVGFHFESWSEARASAGCQWNFNAVFLCFRSRFVLL